MTADQGTDDTRTLEAVLAAPARFALTPAEIKALRALSARTREDLQSILGPERLQSVQDAIGQKNGATLIGNDNVKIDQAVKQALSERIKDQKVVELELAASIAERLMSWAKLFAAAIALPAALIIGVLTILGVSKYSDFSKLIGDSEVALKSSVANAAAHAKELERTVAEIAQKQQLTEQSVTSLSRELSSVREQLGFAPGTAIKPDLQREMQERFRKFQAHLVSLGYAPGEQEIKLQLLRPDESPGAIGWYSNNTIFIRAEAINDPGTILREYLHHVLYSRTGFDNVGFARSALESGIADYIVSSWLDTPSPYTGVLGKQFSLDHTQRYEAARGHEDRYKVGEQWGGAFWQIRNAVGRDNRNVLDKALLSAWFELTKETADPAVPSTMIAALLRQPGLAQGNRTQAVAIMRRRGLPVSANP